MNIIYIIAKKRDNKILTKDEIEYFVNNYTNGKRKRSGNANFPPSDDGQDHNSYFGMNFDVKFELPKDYIGPLEYTFFGDDDMWVFLTPVDENGTATGASKLVCDIGGVHSSVGEYVNKMKRSWKIGVLKKKSRDISCHFSILSEGLLVLHAGCSLHFRQLP